MKTFSALLALCAGNSQLPAQRPVTRNFDAFFDLRIEKNGWVSNRGAGDLGRHCAHYDVIVMSRWIHLSVCRTDWYYSDQHFVIISRCYKEHFSANELLKKEAILEGILLYYQHTNEITPWCYDAFIHVLQGCFTGNGANIRLLRCQLCKPQG